MIPLLKEPMVCLSEQKKVYSGLPCNKKAMHRGTSSLHLTYKCPSGMTAGPEKTLMLILPECRLCLLGLYLPAMSTISNILNKIP